MSDELPPVDEPDAPDPDESPFEAAAIEGMPYERGSLEDRAIQEILAERSRRERSESR
jgi:hypothetical protein